MTRQSREKMNKMPKFIKSLDFKEGTPGFKIPYGCAFSPMLRLAVRTVEADIQRHIEAVVQDIDSNEKIARSLKAPSEFRTYRQVDIKKSSDPNSDILLKCFLVWGKDNVGQELWIVFAEGARETFWEDQFGPRIGSG